MEIRDVVGSMREQLLEQQLKLQALQSTVDMLERFTWNLVKFAAEGTLVVTFEEEDPNGDPSID